MQNPAKVGGGGVAAPKPPHSLNSSSVLPPEPPVLVSESHSGHCTDFLKVVTFFLYSCATSVTLAFTQVMDTNPSRLQRPLAGFQVRDLVIPASVTQRSPSVRPVPVFSQCHRVPCRRSQQRPQRVAP